MTSHCACLLRVRHLERTLSYLGFSDDQTSLAIVAYLRSLPPVQKRVSPRRLSFVAKAMYAIGRPRGQTIYNAYCLPCHGDRGSGGPFTTLALREQVRGFPGRTVAGVRIYGERSRGGSQAPPLLSLIHLSTEQFRLRFAGTAILRAGRDGFVRNVAIALGNSRSPRAVDALAIGVREEGALVRAHAAWALGRIGGTTARLVLADAHKREAVPEVRDEIELALALECVSKNPSPIEGGCVED